MHRVKEQMGFCQRECTGIVHTALKTHKKLEGLRLLSYNWPKGEAGMNHPLIKDKVNSELLQFYWELRQDIVGMQKTAKWGDGFLKQHGIDLSSEFPDRKGFSLRNLKYIKQCYLFYVQKPFENRMVQSFSNACKRNKMTELGFNYGGFATIRGG